MQPYNPKNETHNHIWPLQDKGHTYDLTLVNLSKSYLVLHFYCFDRKMPKKCTTYSELEITRNKKID